MIYEHIKRKHQLTIYKCSGIIPTQELFDSAKFFFHSEPTLNHLWDTTDADLSQVKGNELEELAKLTKQYAPERAGGRTAFVAPDDLNFGLARMYATYSEITGFQVEMKVFRTHKEAEQWISAASCD
jgi:hypothetical protein